MAAISCYQQNSQLELKEILSWLQEVKIHSKSGSRESVKTLIDLSNSIPNALKLAEADVFKNVCVLVGDVSLVGFSFSELSRAAKAALRVFGIVDASPSSARRSHTPNDFAVFK